MSNTKTNSYKTINLDAAFAGAAKTSLRAKQKKERTAAEAKAGVATRKPVHTQTTEQVLRLSDNLREKQSLFPQILQILRKKDSTQELINPRSQWTWEQRFAVKKRRAGIPTSSVNKAEIAAALVRLHPADRPLLRAGFKMDYAYSPTFTDPDVDVWAYLCRDLLPEQFYREELARQSKMIFIPPTVANMVRKTAKYLGPDMPQIHPQYLELMHKYYKVQVPATAFSFPKTTIAPKDDLDGYVEQVVSHLAEWFSCPDEPLADGSFAKPRAERRFVLKNTSPGSPYVVTDSPDGLPWRSCHAPGFLEHFLHGPTSVVSRFLRMATKEVLSARKRAYEGVDDAVPDQRRIALGRFVDRGRRFYTKVLAQNHASLDDGGLDVTSFWSHFVRTVMAGNIKPVTLDEIEEGKPDRSVYNDPALIRFFSAKFSLLAYAHLSCPWYHKPGWMNGKAGAFVREAAAALDETADVRLVDGPIPTLKAIEFPHCVDIKPDVRAMDMHTHPEILKDYYEHDLIGPLVPVAQRTNIHVAVLAFVIGVLSEAAQHPMCLTNSGVMYFPKHLNSSGAAHTYMVNMKNTTPVYLGLRGELPGQKYVLQKEYAGVRFFHRAVGDDQMIVIRLPEIATPTGFLPINSRDRDGSILAATTSTFNAFVKFFRGSDPDKVTGLMKEVQKFAGWEFKPETLAVSRNLSATAFLGHHLYVSEEFVTKEGDAGAVLAARPLHQILFSAEWPKSQLTKRQQEAGLTHNVYTAVRAISAMLEASAAYPGVRMALTNIFEEKKKVLGQVGWDSDPLRELVNDELSNPHLWGFEQSALDIIEDSDPDFILSHAPSLEQIWRLHTGQELPRRIALESSEEPLEEDLELDLSDLEPDLTSSDEIPKPAGKGKERERKVPQKKSVSSDSSSYEDVDEQPFTAIEDIDLDDLAPAVQRAILDQKDHASGDEEAGPG
jgi:hypothetical protein